MNKTSIEYLTHSWSPVAMRCTPISEGCANCWHLAMAKRLAANPAISDERRAAYAGGVPFLVESELNAPLRRKKPARIGVQFMGDLWHEDVNFSAVDRVFDVMARCSHHDFLLLTKRPRRAFDYMAGAFDRIIALLYNGSYEQRDGVLRYGRFGRDRDRFPRTDMAAKEAPWSGSSIRRRISEGIKGQSMSACTRRVSNTARVSPDHKNAQGSTGDNGGASGSLGVFQPPDSTRLDHQSQEWAEGRQSPVQFGVGNIQRPASARARSTECESPSSNWIQAPQDTSGGGRCAPDSATENSRNDGQGYSDGIRDETQGYLGHLSTQDLEAHLKWPLPNVWLGVTAENQHRADERIPILLSIPAAGHFVSLEPMLSVIDISEYLIPYRLPLHSLATSTKTVRPALAHVILGGESGPGARPLRPDWARSVRDQCQEAGTPFVFKSWGAWGLEPAMGVARHRIKDQRNAEGGYDTMYRVGKRAAGRLLDGKLWDEYPETE